MPIYACKFSRARFHKTYGGFTDYGKCASKKETFYGLRLHSLIAFDGYITDFTLTSIRLETKILAHNICCFINKVLRKSVDTLKIK